MMPRSGNPFNIIGSLLREYTDRRGNSLENKFLSKTPFPLYTFGWLSCVTTDSCPRPSQAL